MDSDLRAAIAKYVRHAGYQAAKPVVIAQRLGLTDDEQEKSVRLVIKKMVQAGELAYRANHMVVPPERPQGAESGSATAPAASSDAPKPSGKQKSQRGDEGIIVGTFRRVSSGDGFVRPVGTAASVGRDDDIHIAAAAAKDA